MDALKISKNQGRIYVSYPDTVSGKLYSSYINKDYLNTTKNIYSDTFKCRNEKGEVVIKYGKRLTANQLTQNKPNNSTPVFA